MLKITLSFLILLLAFPSGYLLAYLCRDELIEGRKYFKLLALVSFILALVFLFFNLATSLSLLFVAIVSFISLWKSKDKKFIR